MIKAFVGLFIEIVQVHVPDLDLSTVTVQDSRNGNFSVSKVYDYSARCRAAFCFA